MTRLLVGALLCAGVTQVTHPPLPDLPAAELSRRVRQGVRLNDQIQKDFTYLELRRDVKFSKLGRVTIGPPRTFQVVPEPVPRADL